MKIAASFLSSKNVEKDLITLNLTDVEYIHIDHMDGKFVKEKTMPFKDMRNIYKFTSKRLDVHLMCLDLEKQIKNYATLNTEFITFHVENNQNVDKLIDLVHKFGIKCGIAINPNTEIELIYPYLQKLDLVLMMTVEAGYGGQEFVLEALPKIELLKEKIRESNLNIKIEVDGGINFSTIDYVKDIDVVVVGSCIINSDNFQETITKLRQ